MKSQCHMGFFKSFLLIFFLHKAILNLRNIYTEEYMELFSVSLHQITIMALLMLVGIYCYRKKFLNEDHTQALSKVLLNVINPLVVFQSFLTSLTPELLKSLSGSFILSTIGFVVLILLSPLLIKRKNNPNYEVESVAFIYSNTGFIAIPLVNAIWGSEGVIYLTPALTISTFFFWTHAYTMISGNKIDKHNLLKTLTTPVYLAIYAGIFCMLTGLRPPRVINDTVSSVASMNTPLAMMVAGITIAQTDICAALRKMRSYYIVFLKVIVAPLITIALCLPFVFLGYDNLMLSVFCLSFACPTAASYVMLAVNFGKNATYCSELFVISTLFSAISLPLVVFATRIFTLL